MALKTRTIKVNKDKSLSKIQYGKKDIWWFFQWLKVCVDLQGTSLEFNQANKNRRKSSIKHKIKINGWNDIDLKEIKSIKHHLKMTDKEMFNYLNKMFNKYIHLFGDFTIKYIKSSKDLVQDDNYFTVQIPISKNRAEIDIELDKLKQIHKIPKSEKSRAVTFYRPIKHKEMSTLYKVWLRKNKDFLWQGKSKRLNNSEIAKNMRLLHSHGITRDPDLMDSEPHGPWFYEQIGLGFNYRMTDIQAALGLSQLKRLDTFVSQRHKLAKRYLKKLSELPLFLPHIIGESYSSFHLFVVRLNLSKIAISQKQVFEFLRHNGIGVNLHYIPVHTQPFYKRMGYKLGDYPNAEQYYREAITLPIYPSLTNKQQDYIISTLRLSLTKDTIKL